LGENYEYIQSYRFDIDLGVHNFLEQLNPVFVVEWRKTGDHFVDKASQAPPVHFCAVPLLANDFRCEVLRSTTDGLGLVVLALKNFGEPKVSQFDVARFVDNDVLWFEAE
jgi:hypothetical protein